MKNRKMKIRKMTKSTRRRTVAFDVDNFKIEEHFKKLSDKSSEIAKTRCYARGNLTRVKGNAC